MRNQRSSQPKPSSRAAGLGLTALHSHAGPRESAALARGRVGVLVEPQSPCSQPFAKRSGSPGGRCWRLQHRPRWLQAQHARLWDRRVRQARSGSAAPGTPPLPSSQEGRAHRVRTGQVVPGGRSVDGRGRSHRGNAHSNGSARPPASGRQMRLRNPRPTAPRIPPCSS